MNSGSTRNSSSSQKIEEIIFLGAGASAAEDAPVQRNLFSEYFSGPSTTSERITLKRNEALKGFFSNFFGIDTSPPAADTTWPTFEEALGVIELAINRRECYRGYSEHSLKEVRDALILLIAEVLEEKLRNPPRAGKCFHNQLVERLFAKGTLITTCFISLNYDILIDNALEDDFKDLQPDYGVIVTHPRQGEERRERANKVKLYKLHGSLNWLYCPTCIRLILHPGEKAVVSREGTSCSRCKTPIVPLLIPPTFFKVMENCYLQQIWHVAQDAFNQAQRIYFCGYSFPDADMHIKYLIKRAELNRKSDWEIFIINNQSTLPSNDKASLLKDQRKKELWKLYHRFFNQKTSKVKFTTLSFQDFCERDIKENDIIRCKKLCERQLDCQD